MRLAALANDPCLGGREAALDKRTSSAIKGGGGGASDGGRISDPRAAPRRLLEALVADAPTGLAALDADGHVVLANDAFCRLLGQSRDEVIGARLEDALDPGGDAVRDTLARLSEFPRHTFSARAAAARRWLRIDLTRIGAAPYAVAVSLVDADDVRRLEREFARMRSRYERLESMHRVEAEAHRDSERRLQFALDAARMGTWSWDPIRDVAYHDARAREILAGAAGEGTFAKALERHLAPEAAERYRRGLERIIDPASDVHHFEVELPWRRPNGEWMWVLMTGEAHFEGEGAEKRVTLVTGTVVDITARKLNEEALKEASRQKDRFLATLAHELRNPLAPLYYAVDLLQSESRDELEWARGVIERQVSHLTRLIDDLLDISRIGRGQLEVRREPVVVQDVVHAAVEASRGALKEHEQELIVDLPPAPVVVRGDFVRLTQVVTNLLTNAAKFSPRPGTVEVTVETEPDSRVRLSVKDTGVGISPEDLPHVFEMFYRGGGSVERPYGGLGVGLYLVRSLVELHGGTISAESEGRGRGAVFTVRLPVEDSESAPPRPSGGRTEGTALSSKRVLIVDDNRDSADALAKLLRSGGNDVTTAYEGCAALAAAERLKPDVVLLDLGMPTIDGYEVCRRIRERQWGKDILLVALTGWGRAEDRERTREAGFDEHLVKPVGLADVESMLRARSETA